MGSCGKCSDELKRTDKYVSCAGICDKTYHAKCVNITILEVYNLITTNKNIGWFCDSCVRRKNYLRIIMEGMTALTDLKDTIEKQDEKIDLLKEHVTTYKNDIKSDIKELINEKPEPTYAEKLKIKKHEPVLIIKPKKQEQKSVETKNEIKKSIDPTNLDVSGLRSVRNGGVLIECKNQDTVNKIKETAESKLGSAYEVKIPKKKLPRVKIVGITEKLLPEIIEEKIKLQNANLNTDQTCLKVVHIKENKKRRGYIAYAEVNALAYRIMMKEERVNIGWDSCRVYDAVEITRCFSCSGFNHKASECKSKKACPKCAGPHLLRDCTDGEENVKCINCMETMDKLKIKLDVGHPAWSHDCPVYKRKLEQERSKINFLE